MRTRRRGPLLPLLLLYVSLFEKATFVSAALISTTISDGLPASIGAQSVEVGHETEGAASCTGSEQGSDAWGQDDATYCNFRPDKDTTSQIIHASDVSVLSGAVPGEVTQFESIRVHYYRKAASGENCFENLMQLRIDTTPQSLDEASQEAWTEQWALRTHDFSGPFSRTTVFNADFGVSLQVGSGGGPPAQNCAVTAIRLELIYDDMDKSSTSTSTGDSKSTTTTGPASLTTVTSSGVPASTTSGVPASTTSGVPAASTTSGVPAASTTSGVPAGSTTSGVPGTTSGVPATSGISTGVATGTTGSSAGVPTTAVAGVSTRGTPTTNPLSTPINKAGEDSGSEESGTSVWVWALIVLLFVCVLCIAAAAFLARRRRRARQEGNSQSDEQLEGTSGNESSSGGLLEERESAYAKTPDFAGSSREESAYAKTPASEKSNSVYAKTPDFSTPEEAEPAYAKTPASSKKRHEAYAKTPATKEKHEAYAKSPASL
jgi:hypothetical protein